MHVGLYFGSFNPIHVGHLIIAGYISNNTDLEQVWFVISPQNPLKPSATLLNKYHRKYLIDITAGTDSGDVVVTLCFHFDEFFHFIPGRFRNLVL